MGKNSKEDYLDQLLYTMDDGSSAKKSGKEKKDISSEDRWEREIFGESDFGKDGVTDEEEFLREFEAELLQDELPDTPVDFWGRGNDPERDEAEGSHNAIADEPISPEREPEVDENAEFEGELPGDAEEPDAGQQENAFEKSEKLDEAMGAFDEKLSSEEQEDLDLSGMKDQDLMDMLSGDDSLSDLGQLLIDEEEGNQIAGEDAIGDFARIQMDEQRQMTSSPEADAGSVEEQSGEKKKKSSLLAKISRILFGEGQDDTVVLTDDSLDDVMALSEENQQILNELEAADREASGKGKKKKKKKEKKKKDPKPKKEKKKKEKKPKSVDNTPPLPKGPVIAIVIMVASLLGLVMLGTSLLGYQANVNAAKEAYQKGTYLEAYQKMQGLTVKPKDEKLYNRLAALASVSEKYQAYLIFDHNGSRDMALDSLVCAYGRYEINLPYAKEYECEPQMEELREKIAAALKKDFSMTEKEAAELYRIKNRDEYTIELRKKLETSDAK